MGFIKKMQQGNDLLSFWPVGSIYLSVNSTNPANFFGGTWTQIKDKFLLAAGDTYAAGAEGGQTTHKHSTQGHALSIAEMPSHNHNNRSLTGKMPFRPYGTSGSGTDIPLAGDSSLRAGIVTGQNAVSWSGSHAVIDASGRTITGVNVAQVIIDASHTHDSQGGGSSHSHGDTGETTSMPPYLAVYVWKRIA